MRIFDATGRRLLRTFLTGLLAARPLSATVLVFVWAARLLYDWVGPGSLIGTGLMLLFTLLQGLYLSRHLPDEPTDSDPQLPSSRAP